MINVMSPKSIWRLLSAPKNIWSVKSSSDGWNSSEKALHYKQNSNLQLQWAFQALSMAKTIESSDAVLDFGCGDGKISSLMSFHAKSVYGYDISPYMIECADRLYNKSNLKFDSSPAYLLQNYDVITSFCVFHLVDNPLEVLTELASRLKVGGHLIAAYPGNGDSSIKQAVLDSFKELPFLGTPLMPYRELNMRERSDVQKILHRAGFSGKVQCEVERFRFYDESEFKSWAIGTLSANLGIPPKHEKQFFDVFIDKYKGIDREASLPCGAFAPKFNKFIVIAKKA